MPVGFRFPRSIEASGAVSPDMLSNGNCRTETCIAAASGVFLWSATWMAC